MRFFSFILAAFFSFTAHLSAVVISVSERGDSLDEKEQHVCFQEGRDYFRAAFPGEFKTELSNGSWFLSCQSEKALIEMRTPSSPAQTPRTFQKCIKALIKALGEEYDVREVPAEIPGVLYVIEWESTEVLARFFRTQTRGYIITVEGKLSPSELDHLWNSISFCKL